jgi:hypothetical protein
MKELFSDFAQVKAHTKSSGLKYADAIIDYYRKLGDKQGFTVLSGSTVIKNAYDFGRLELVWVEPNVVFCHEFGLLDDIYRHLWRIMVFRPRVAVLLLSGMSKCSPQKVKEIVSHTPQLAGIEFIVLDVTGEKLV